MTSSVKVKSINLKFNEMEHRKSKLIVSVILVMASSCNEPETVVTNIVNTDGSVTRQIEMKNTENKFETSAIQVPFDSTWIVRDSLELGGSADTLWVKRAEKVFASVDEINRAYRNDSGANKAVSRHAEFSKKFKWFNTQYNFSEIIDKKMKYGYPVSEYLNQEELKWFYSPDNLIEEKKNGPDSLKFRAFSDTLDHKTEKWMMKCLVSEWIGEFTKLAGEKATGEMSAESLKKREDEFVKIVEGAGPKFDSLWTNGFLLKKFIGETNSIKYKAEADSAVHIATDHLFVSFNDYTVRTVMPGKLTGTNGLIDSSGVPLWPVKSEYFLTEPYEMMAESKVPNTWAWIVSGLFLLFVVTGIIIKRKGKG